MIEWPSPEGSHRLLRWRALPRRSPSQGRSSLLPQHRGLVFSAYHRKRNDTCRAAQPIAWLFVRFAGVNRRWRSGRRSGRLGWNWFWGLRVRGFRLPCLTDMREKGGARHQRMGFCLLAAQAAQAAPRGWWRDLPSGNRQSDRYSANASSHCYSGRRTARRRSSSGRPPSGSPSVCATNTAMAWAWRRWRTMSW